MTSAFFWPRHARILGHEGGSGASCGGSTGLHGVTASEAPRGRALPARVAAALLCSSSATGLFSRKLGASAPGPQEASAGGPRTVTLAPCLSPWRQRTPTSKDVPEGAWGAAVGIQAPRPRPTPHPQAALPVAPGYSEGSSDCLFPLFWGPWTDSSIHSTPALTHGRYRKELQLQLLSVTRPPPQ